MADLTQWADAQPQSKDLGQQSLDLYHYLNDELGGVQIVAYVNAQDLPKGTVGIKARELAKGLTRGWAQTVAFAWIEDGIIDEGAIDSAQGVRAIVDWIMDVLGG
jgi:hypothetical protein